MDTQDGNAMTTPSSRGVDIHKRYVMSKDNFVDALQGASLEIDEGEMVAIMGPSGSGKSTLLHILGCLDSLNSGEVWLDGRRVDNLSRRDLAQLRRNEVGFIFQTFNLVPSLTALENVMLAAEYAGKGRREAREAAQECSLPTWGCPIEREHRPTELSGGQQQRVAIARALVNGPKVIFGDEPTGNLDSASSAEIVEHDAPDQPRDGHDLRPGHPRPRRGRDLRPGVPHAGRAGDELPLTLPGLQDGPTHGLAPRRSAASSRARRPARKRQRKASSRDVSLRFTSE